MPRYSAEILFDPIVEDERLRYVLLITKPEEFPEVVSFPLGGNFLQKYRHAELVITDPGGVILSPWESGVNKYFGNSNSHWSADIELPYPQQTTNQQNSTIPGTRGTEKLRQSNVRIPNPRPPKTERLPTVPW